MRHITNFDKIAEFEKTFSGDEIPEMSEKLLGLRLKLIVEEFDEVCAEFDKASVTTFVPSGAGSGYDFTSTTIYDPNLIDKVALAKELADLLYVVYGTFENLGINANVVFDAVHRSNMSKANPDGTVSRREDGKILKPSTYKPAQIDLSMCKHVER